METFRLLSSVTCTGFRFVYLISYICRPLNNLSRTDSHCMVGIFPEVILYEPDSHLR